MKMKVFEIFKNNWKKSLFGASVLGYSAYYVKTEYDISKHMRSICNQVVHVSNRVGEAPKQVLVVLNPIANKKKTENLFKKYCEPILNLAGYSVEISKTNYVGHAKLLIEGMKVLPDAIVVAGGDGTSSEVITGLMRRREQPCPIAIIPLGRKSETASKFLKLTKQNNKVEHVKALTDAILAMVNGKISEENIIKYDVINSNEDMSKKNLKSIYGLHEFSWGLLKDIESIKDKYWYFGSLRYQAAALFNSFSKNLNWKFSTDFTYTPPCPGCSVCTQKVESPIRTSYLKNFLMAKTPIYNPRSMVKNESCTEVTNGRIETNQLSISCKKNNENFYELESIFVNSLHPGIDFIKIIPNLKKNAIQPSVIINSRTIQLIPDENTKHNAFYYIDGEEYDVRPIKITIVPQAIKIFC